MISLSVEGGGVGVSEPVPSLDYHLHHGFILVRKPVDVKHIRNLTFISFRPGVSGMSDLSVIRDFT